MLKGLAWLLMLLVLLAAVLGWGAWTRYQDFVATPLAIPAEGRFFTVAPGSRGADIVHDLAAEDLTEAGWEWRLLMRLEPRVYRRGEYRLEAGMDPREVLELFASGRVVQYRLTLVEGWNYTQLAQALRANADLEQRLDLTGLAAWGPLLEELGLAHPEGWFLPETYQFERGDSDLDILRRAHSAMLATLEQAWQGRATGLPLETPYELLILASIIEKETAVEEERAQIAGVFRRRLELGMRLQTDPTVIYGLGEAFDGDLRRRDLQTDTPYNTYTRHGLPPTPIAMPGRRSLLAAAQPADGEALYFVADGNGGHTFSATLEEHQAAVRKLLRRD
jgi:UPF0755 protein